MLSGPDPHPFHSVLSLCSGMRQTSGAGRGGASALTPELTQRCLVVACEVLPC